MNDHPISSGLLWDAVLLTKIVVIHGAIDTFAGAH